MASGRARQRRPAGLYVFAHIYSGRPPQEKTAAHKGYVISHLRRKKVWGYTDQYAGVVQPETEKD
jgi:hypothetical protein